MFVQGAEGCTGHGPIQLLVYSASQLDGTWNPGFRAWARPGLPELHILAGPVQHFQNDLLDTWGSKVAEDLCSRGGFRGGLFFGIQLPLNNSSSHPMVGNETKDYFEAFFPGVYGLDCLFGQSVGNYSLR